MTQLSLFHQPAPLAVPSVAAQTGWHRGHPQQICQEPEVLVKIRAHSYDIDNQAFAAYFLSRYGVDLSHGSVQNFRHLYTTPIEEAENWLLTSPDYTYLQSGLPLSIEDRQAKVTCLRHFRGHLQDIWELFVTHEQTKEAAA